MADTKITALAAITTVDPAADVLPIVDISDTSMAASGTTKKITSNQILGAGGTATLASATITGDLTVATSALKVVSASSRVLINQASAIQGDSLEVSAKSDSGAISLFGRASDNGATLSFRANGVTTAKASLTANDSGLSIRTGTVERYNIDTTGVSTWSVGGSTAMTLNATGLLVGTALSGGSISNASYVLGGIFSTLNGILSSVATATPTTIFAAPSDSILMVTASVNGASPSDYKVLAVVKRGGAVVAITTISSATNVTITSSGTDIQATQTSGGTQNIYFNVLRLA